MNNFIINTLQLLGIASIVVVTGIVGISFEYVLGVMLCQ
jgi:hypothetical protein